MTKKLEPFNRGPVTERSIGLWCIKNPLVDPFGGPVLPDISSIKACEIACWAASQGLIECISAHDDDLVSCDLNNMEDDLDEKSRTHGMLQEIKGMLDEADVKVNMITCNLFSDPVFRRGGLANPDPGRRSLANLKVRRSLRIGNFLGAKHFTYWVARDGYEVPVVVHWDCVLDWIAEGLNQARCYISEQGFTNYVGCTIEAKPNEPRGHMFLPTSGHAIAFIYGMLSNSEFWGVNPELLQHEGMTLIDALNTILLTVKLEKLFFLHFGSQIMGQFDNDFPPLVGPEGLKQTIYMFWLLNQLDWKGVVEFDCHMLRSEGNPNDPIGCRKRFINNCSTALTMALQVAERIPKNLAANPRESESDLIATQSMFGLNLEQMDALARKVHKT